jgi:hypothetical protein
MPAVDARLVEVISITRRLMDLKHEASILLALERAGLRCSRDPIAYHRCESPGDGADERLSIDLHDSYDAALSRRTARLIVNVEAADCTRLDATRRELGAGLRPLPPPTRHAGPAPRPPAPPDLETTWGYESAGEAGGGRYLLRATRQLRQAGGSACRMVVVLQSFS